MFKRAPWLNLRFKRPFEPSLFGEGAVRERAEISLNNFVDAFGTPILSGSDGKFTLSNLELVFRRKSREAFANAGQPDLSIKGIVELLKSDLLLDELGFFGDITTARSLSTFEQLRDYYHLQVHASTYNIQRSFLRAGNSNTGNYISHFELLHFLRARMLTEYPEQSLECALTDPYTVGMLTDMGVHADPVFKRMIRRTPFERQGVILYYVPAYSGALLSAALLKPSLLEAGLGSLDSPFVAVDASKMTLKTMNETGGIFVPTDDFLTSAQLLLMIIEKTFANLDYTEQPSPGAVVKSMLAGIRSHKALSQP